MLKQFVFLVVILVFSFSVNADLNLTKSTYGPNQTFSGYLSFDEDDVDLDEEITGDVTGCGSYDLKEISLYNFLRNASLYSGDLYEYTKVGDGVSPLNLNFDVTEKEYGFWLRPSDNIDDFNFTLSGNANPKIDVGLDGYDWGFFGTFQGWGNLVYSEDYETSYSTYIGNYDSTGYTVNPRLTPACSTFNISIDELQDELLVKINGVAKRVNSGGELKAKIGTQSCVFAQTIGNSWTDVNCNITLDVSSGNGYVEKRVCVESSQDVFRVPEIPENPEYYFITLNPAVYGGNVSGQEISSSSLKEEVEDYLDDNCDSWCIVPFKIYGQLNTDLVFTPEINFNEGGVSNRVYQFDKEVMKYNLSGKLLNLVYFDELRTPDKENDTCFLEISFLGDDYDEPFNLTSGPVAKIKVSSDFAAKGVPISFDGTTSSGGVVSYSWSFGDGKNGTGSTTSHTYSEEGDYLVTLTVKDSKGVSDSDSLTIVVGDIEEALEDKFSSLSEKIETAKSNFRGYKGVLADFSNGMQFLSMIDSKSTNVDTLEASFESARNSNSNSTASLFQIYNSLKEIENSLPYVIYLRNSSLYQGYGPSNLQDIVGFSKTAGIGMNTLSTFKSKVYSYNQQEVDSSYGYYSILVYYLEGSRNYTYVDKNFSSNGGDLVEPAVSPTLFVSGCNYENSSRVILCQNVGSEFRLRYATQESSLATAFIVPSDAYSGVVNYQYECPSGDCDYSYCGDRKCFSDDSLGIYEKDSNNANYCPQDCGRNIPWIWYISLGVFLVIGIFWINFYRGPGNFFEVTNGVSFTLFKKRLFMIEKDKLILKNYVFRALREGFNEGEIRKALQKKGWREKQLDYIFNDVKKAISQYSKGGVSKGF